MDKAIRGQVAQIKKGLRRNVYTAPNSGPDHSRVHRAGGGFTFARLRAGLRLWMDLN